VGDDEAPKSALELAMARLKQKDKAEGVEERPVTDEQRAAIAEARQVAEARLAEQEILHRSKLAQATDHESLEALELEYRRDRERILSDRDQKIEQLRKAR
jgi:hypothetical protein